MDESSNGKATRRVFARAVEDDAYGAGGNRKESPPDAPYLRGNPLSSAGVRGERIQVSQSKFLKFLNHIYFIKNGENILDFRDDFN